MTLSSQFPGGIYAVDFEFHPKNGVDGNLPEPVCMVAHNLLTEQTLHVWRDELIMLDKAPFPTDESALFVAYYSSADIGCFLALGWPLPTRVLDLFTEFRCMTNGISLKHGNGLLGALFHFGKFGIDAEEKTDMRDLVLRTGPWSEKERSDILEYCESDVIALANLLTIMEVHIDLPRALLRGEYMCTAAHIESAGVPIDLPLLVKIRERWDSIQDNLIASIDKDFGAFEGRTFKATRWGKYLVEAGIPWKRLPSGALDLSEENFREMSRAYPQIAPLRELRSILSKMRLATLTVGDDARNRCLLSAFRSTTGRNQPSNSKSVFGPATFIRGLIKPPEGYGVAYIDWSQQEFCIAAALSGDEKMMDAYKSGDPYLAFAIQAGAVPTNATKQSHKAEREQFKACTLAVQYGMGAESLALRINQPIARAQLLLNLHRKTYRQFWKFSDMCLDEAKLGGRLWTKFGWEIQVGSDANERSLQNFPMQSHGAEMLRIACILLTRAGIRICLPVHDAILIEAPLAELDSAIDTTRQLMAEASRIVLGGIELSSDVKVIRYPDRYMDDRGLGMWNTVMRLIDENEYPQNQL
jgi:DNA polymerase-1